MTDVIDRLAEAPTGGEELRRPVAKAEAQASFDALFSPVDDTAFPVAERWLIASFATRLTADDTAAAFYAAGATEHDAERASLVRAAAEESAVAGPYGVYAEPGLASESTDGLRYTASDDVFGPRLAAALEHAHLLTARPRETDRATHERLLEAGWSIDGIVTLSQLVAFLAFQQRVAAGLRVLAQHAIAPKETAA